MSLRTTETPLPVLLQYSEDWDGGEGHVQAIFKRECRLGLEDQEGYSSTEKSDKQNSMRKDREAWVGVQCPQEWWTHNKFWCVSVVSVGLQLWRLSPHISQVRRLRPREIKEPVVDKLSAGCFSFTSPAACLIPILGSSSFVFFSLLLWNLVHFHFVIL